MKKPKKHLSLTDAVIASNQTIRRNIRNENSYWFDFCGKLANRTLQGFQISAIKAGIIKKITDAINTEYAVVFNNFQDELSSDLRKTGIFKNYDAKMVYTVQTIEIAMIYRLFYRAFTKTRVSLVFRDMEKDTEFSEDTNFDELLKVKHLSLTVYINKQKFDTDLISDCILHGKSDEETINSFSLSELIANYNKENN